LKKP